MPIYPPELPPNSWGYIETDYAGTPIGDPIYLPIPPTTVEYDKDRIKYTIVESTSGAAVVQRYRFNHSAELIWKWTDLGPWYQFNGKPYEEFYWELFELQSHVRQRRGKSPYIYLGESATGTLPRLDQQTEEWYFTFSKAVVTYVGRTPMEHGGRLYYPVTELRFNIVDHSVQGF
jgi:hypothetical protein